MNINVKDLLKNSKQTAELGLFQIEALEQENSKWKSAFQAMLVKVNDALGKDDLDAVKADFAQLIESFKQTEAN